MHCLRFVLSILLIAVILVMASCTTAPEVKLNQGAASAGPKYIFVNMGRDPDLLALDIKAALEKFGFKVDLSTGGTELAQTVINKNTLTTYKNVSQSSARYELIVSYRGGGFPYRKKWRAILRDRANSTVIGTYKYEHSEAGWEFGRSNEEIIKSMIHKLILPYWHGRTSIGN